MQKSILIIGRPGSGKTTKLNEILSKLEVNYLLCRQMEYADVVNDLKFKSNVKIDCLAVEEVVDVEDIEMVMKFVKDNQMYCIVTTQLSVKELSEKLLSECEIISCEWSF
ncbi:MAG: hypothetical protein RJA07_2765 [Bacteroidota bacterium]|jgi:broad-specificity NMP kinase